MLLVVLDMKADVNPAPDKHPHSEENTLRNLSELC
jgi:hypothetical protein